MSPFSIKLISVALNPRGYKMRHKVFQYKWFTQRTSATHYWILSERDCNVTQLKSPRGWVMDFNHHCSGCWEINWFRGVRHQLQPNLQKKASLTFIPPFTTAHWSLLRTQGGNMVVFGCGPSFFPPYLHGDTPALHSRVAVAHVAVAAIGRGLGRVRLRQISPHGYWIVWLCTWRGRHNGNITFLLHKEKRTHHTGLVSHFGFVCQAG